MTYLDASHYGFDGGWFDNPEIEGQSLDDFVQQYVAGVSGLPGPMVRPRWQPEPPNMPDYGVDWCGVGIMNHRPIGVYAWVKHYGEGDGHDKMQRHEELDVLCSFYGNNDDKFAGNLHNGLMIWQHYAVLRNVGMALVEVQAGLTTPEFIKGRWWPRTDLPFVLRRIIVRDYPILNLRSAKGTVHPDPGNYHAPFQVVAQP